MMLTTMTNIIKDLDYLTKSNEPRYNLSYYKSKDQDQRQRMESYDWDVYNLEAT